MASPSISYRLDVGGAAKDRGTTEPRYRMAVGEGYEDALPSLSLYGLHALSNLLRPLRGLYPRLKVAQLFACQRLLAHYGFSGRN
jgi:hypothetical protein